MDKIEIEVRLESGIQQLGMAWIVERLKQSLRDIDKAGGGIREVGEIKISRTVFSNKIE